MYIYTYSDMYRACKLFHTNGLFVRLHHAVFQLATPVNVCRILPAGAYATGVFDFFLRNYKSLRGRVMEQGHEAILLVHFCVEADDEHENLATTCVEHLRNFKAPLIGGG